VAKILIVDDDPDIVEAVQFFLEKAGHQIACAYDRREGEAKIAEFDPDLLILDVMMEQADDGLAMAQGLRRRGWKRPILMLTSLGQVTGLDYGKDDALVPVDDFQEKPVAPEELVNRVQKLLTKKEG
jgi:DNA-binding response OmpR family regulator